MTWLRDVLDDVAHHAPQVDLTERTIGIRRRRRRRTTSIVAAAAVVAVALGVTTAVRLQRAQPRPAAAPGAVTDLPARGVGPLSHAFMTFCRPEGGKAPAGCVNGGWRVVTRGGKTYRVARALSGSPSKLRPSPLAISRNGRKIAYYDTKAGTFAVRDLASGKVTTAPAKVPTAWLGSIAHLLLSDDGRFLAFTKSPALKDPAMLFDMRERMARPLPNGWNPIGLSPDGDTITLAEYAPKTRLQTITRLWQTSTAGNSTTVDVAGDYSIGALGPDGHSVVAVESVNAGVVGCMRSGPDLVHLDRKTGKALRKVPVRGLSMTANQVYLRGWTGPHEITALATPLVCHERDDDAPASDLDPPYVPFTAYAVNVETGVARKLATYTAQGFFHLVLPGFPGTL
ncbi:hypothetical protein Nocox_20715 [Nonomuraea coxensis DSM 45129]|uniref:WD40 repeat protein n=1 Tax=Nonomuraea coxensis DSM 45129 TaxID=1122611 RepID=A0ABX8U201_9ACTN|nr:hypothetical protein [Nonomuraea coxensis]QYC41751.1 hypothetical protein Nocox_20715 [Nonomuraea coxensis DSM 45129]